MEDQGPLAFEHSRNEAKLRHDGFSEMLPQSGAITPPSTGSGSTNTYLPFTRPKSLRARPYQYTPYPYPIPNKSMGSYQIQYPAEKPDPMWSDVDDTELMRLRERHELLMEEKKSVEKKSVEVQYVSRIATTYMEAREAMWKDLAGKLGIYWKDLEANVSIARPSYIWDSLCD